MSNILYYILLFLPCEASLNSSIFQCLPNSDQPGQSWVPNIPSTYFNDLNTLRKSDLTVARFGFTYVFEIPAQGQERDCFGNVSAVQVCYESREAQNGSRELMQFLVIEKEGAMATVKFSFPISVSPLASTCSNVLQVCCEVVQLSIDNQLQFTTSRFVFGLMITQQGIQPLAFAPAATDYNVNHYQVSLGLVPPKVFSLEEQSLTTDQSLMLMRFIIGKSIDNSLSHSFP